MKAYRFFWDTHRWTGIILSLVFLNTAVTGTLLLLKKRFSSIQPPTRTGSDGGIAEFITNQELFRIVFAEDGGIEKHKGEEDPEP